MNAVRIIRTGANTYDVYDRASGHWLFSGAADGILQWMCGQHLTWVDVIEDKEEQDG